MQCESWTRRAVTEKCPVSYKLCSIGGEAVTEKSRVSKQYKFL